MAPARSAVVLIRIWRDLSLSLMVRVAGCGLDGIGRSGRIQWLVAQKFLAGLIGFGGVVGSAFAGLAGALANANVGGGFGGGGEGHDGAAGHRTYLPLV